MTRGFAGIESAINEQRERAAESGLLPDIYWRDDRNTGGPLHLQVVRFLPAADENGNLDVDGVVQTHKFYEFLTINDGETKRHFIQPTEGPDYVAENVKEMYRGEIKPPYARTKTVALAVLREEVNQVVDGRNVRTYVDKVPTAKQGGTANSGPMFGIIREAHKTFWSIMMGYYQRFGTICDRDYIIERTGNGRDTMYSIIPCDPIPELDSDEKVLANYNPPTTLDAWVKMMASQDRAKALLGPAPDGRKAPEVQPGFQPAQPQQQQQYGQMPQYGAPQGYPAQMPGYGAPQGYPPAQMPPYGAPQGYPPAQMPQQGGYAPQAYSQPQQPYHQQYGQTAQGYQQPPAQGYQQPPAQTQQAAPQGPPPGYAQPPAPAPQQQAAPQQQGFTHPPAQVSHQGPPQPEPVSEDFTSLREELIRHTGKQ